MGLLLILILYHVSWFLGLSVIVSSVGFLWESSCFYSSGYISQLQHYIIILIYVLRQDL